MPTRRLGSVRGYSAFKALKSAKSAVRASNWQLACVANGLPEARFAVNVAKRLVALAVKRNLLKRLARESFRTFYRQANSAGGTDYLLTLIAMPRDWSRAALRRDLDNLVSKVISSR